VLMDRQGNGLDRALLLADLLRRAGHSVRLARAVIPFELAVAMLPELAATRPEGIGGNFEQVAELVQRLKAHAPVGVCLDTCHTHVSGYDFTTEEGYRETIMQADITFGVDAVRVWHCNDAKALRGSKLDRHEHIGQGNIGIEPFRWLLNDPRFADCAFVAETPNDDPADEERNVKVLKSLVA